MKPTVGFLGLGTMGSLMAANLARAGFPLWIYNRTRSKADKLASQIGARAAASPSELAHNVEVLFTMVSDIQALHHLYFGPDGLAENLEPATVCVEMSTVGPNAVIELAAKLHLPGCRLLDAPVSGSVVAARDARLTVMVGGNAEDLAFILPMLDAMATSVIHVGPLGSGAAMKLSVNTIIFGLNQALAEGLVLAECAGISRAVAYNVIENSAAAAPFVHYRRDAFLQERDVPVGFSLHLARKDLQLIENAGRQNGAYLPQAALNHQIISEAIADGHEAEDVSAVASHLRKTSSRKKSQ
jgi:3-hydroxyisobutyrate dehydrogenase-like beta-hydroxyacid dehydrogenase